MRSQETSNRKSDAWNMMRLAIADQDQHRFHAELQNLNSRDLLAQDYETGNTLLHFALESSYGLAESFFSLLLAKIMPGTFMPYMPYMLQKVVLLLNTRNETILSLIIQHRPDHLNRVINAIPDDVRGKAALLIHADQETLLSLIIKRCPDHLNSVITKIPGRYLGQAALLLNADQETLLSLIIKRCPDHLNSVIIKIPDCYLGQAALLTHADQETLLSLIIKHCPDHLNRVINAIPDDVRGNAALLIHADQETLLSLIIKYGVPDQIRMCIFGISPDVLEEALCQMTGPPDRSVSVFYQMADKYPTMIEEIRELLEPGVLQSVLSLQTYSGNLPFHSLLQGSAFTLVHKLIRMLTPLEIIQLMFWKNEQGITPLEEMSFCSRDYPSHSAMRRASSSPVPISSAIDEGLGFGIIDSLIDALIEVNDENNLPRLFDFITLAGSSKGSQWVDTSPLRFEDFITLAGSSKGSQWVDTSPLRFEPSVLHWLKSMTLDHLEKALANLHSGPREMTALDCLAGTFSEGNFTTLIQWLDAGVLERVFARSEANGAVLLENAMRCSLGLFQAWMQISSDVSYSDVLYVALQTPNDADNSLFHTWMRNDSLTEGHIYALILKFTPAQMGELLLQQNRTGITPLLIAMKYMHTQPLLSLIQGAKMEPSREVLIQLLNYALKKKSSLTKFGNSQQIEEFNEVVLTLMDRGVHLLAVKPSRENSSNGRAFFVEFMHKKLDKIQLALRDCPSVEEFKRTEGTGSCVLLGHLHDIVSTRISESGVSRIATRGGRGFNDALRVLLDKIDRLSFSLGLSSKSALIKEMIDPPAPLSSAIIVEPEVTFLPSAPPAPLSDGIIAVLPKATFLPSAPPAPLSSAIIVEPEVTFLPSAPPAEEEDVEESRESLVGVTLPPAPVAILVGSYMPSDDIPMAHVEVEEEEKEVNTLSSRSWVSALFSPKKSNVSSEERKAGPAP